VVIGQKDAQIVLYKIVRWNGVYMRLLVILSLLAYRIT